jgi:hypothetical protein
MQSSLNFLLLGLASAGLLCAPGDVVSAQGSDLDWSMTAAPFDNQTIKVLSGGGRIWEGGHVSRPSCEITFSGHIKKTGPGNTSMDYQCRWSIHFKDVRGTDLDKAVFTAWDCRDMTVWRAGGDPDISMRVVLSGDLNGEPGYSVIMVVVDNGEPSGQDQIRFRLYRGDVVIGDLDPLAQIYDTDEEFAVYPEISHRTYLDSGNLQSKVESTDL